MNIAEVRARIKAFREARRERREALKNWLQTRLGALPKDVLVVAVVALASFASFALGMLVEREVGQGSAFEVRELPFEEEASAAAAEEGVALASKNVPKGGEVVASKTGSKYYYPWCSGVSRISAANRVTFASAEEAESRGYTIASTCN